MDIIRELFSGEDFNKNRRVTSCAFGVNEQEIAKISICWVDLSWKVEKFKVFCYLYFNDGKFLIEIEVQFKA